MTKLIFDSDYGMNEYVMKAMKTADYPERGGNLVYPALGLCGEAGELAEKIKKLWRNKGVKDGGNLSLEDYNALIKEIGDCLWYLAAICDEVGIPLSLVADTNILKLEDRQQRGVIKSSGDNR